MTRSGSAPPATVVVVTWNAQPLVAEALASLADATIPHRIVVVDNGSSDDTVAWVRTHHPEVDLIVLPHNTGFAGGVAAALAQVDTRYIALLNNDACAQPGWLETATAYLDAHPTVAAVTSRMLLTDADAPTVNNAGIVLRRDGYGADRGLGDHDDARYAVPAEVFGASGGAAVFRTLAVKAAGGIDPAWFMYYEDTDLSWRLRLAGWSIHYCPAAVVRHRHAATSDVRSRSFAFHNERNRLLTLARNAPAHVVATALARHLVTTASLSTKRALRRPVPPGPVFDPGVRLGVVISALRMGPRLVGSRWRHSRRARARVWRAWSGTPSRPLGSAQEHRP